jgi:hypothetical protein
LLDILLSFVHLTSVRRFEAMQKPLDPVQSSQESQGQSLNRRELLKVLTSGGVAIAAASFLPAKWLKPVIEAGVLPAHAQATPTLRIVKVDLNAAAKVPSSPECNILLDGKAYYEDDYGKVGIDPTALLHETEPPGNITDWHEDPPTDPSAGYIKFDTVICVAATGLILTLQVGTRLSEPYNIDFA